MKHQITMTVGRDAHEQGSGTRRRDAIAIDLGSTPLTVKLDLTGALIAAIREAHGDTLSPKSWAALHRAQEAVADAMIHLGSEGFAELPAPEKSRPRIG